MAETILLSFSKILFGKIGGILANEAKLVLGSNHELETLKHNMVYIQGVLKDAENQEHTNNSARIWLQDLESFLYEMDDLLDDIAIEASVQKGSWSKRVRSLFSRSNCLLIQYKLVHHVRDLSEKLEVIRNNGRDFRYNSEVVFGDIQSTKRETSSRLPTWDILGREDEKIIIEDIILSCCDREHVSVIPIVGLGGLGKTTLCQLLYNDKTLEQMFDKNLWVFVSKSFSIRKILVEVIRSTSGDSGDMNYLSMEELRIKVEETMRGKKYLLILDDVWNQDSVEWRQLRDLLDVGAKGSCIIVTTRSVQIASNCSTIDEGKYYCKLKGLPRKVCLSIFKKLAFGDCSSRHRTKFDEMAEEIVDKCDGIPLIVTILGNLLAFNKDDKKWKQVIQRLEGGLEDINSILKLSYDDLSPFLKPCFRISCIFRKGKNVVYAENLMYVWIALGFINYDDHGPSPEDIGRNYIEEFWSKSLLVVSDYSFGDVVNVLQMHDCVTDFALSVSRNDIIALKSSGASSVGNVERIKYILFELGDQTQEELPSELSKVARSRLFKLQASKEVPRALVEEVISSFKLMRVLDFSGCDFEELPNSVGGLKYLRMLSLENNKRLKYLPNSIWKLTNLLTLVLNGCVSLQQLPAGIKKLKKIRSLSLTIREDYLLEEIGMLSSLRFLWINDCSCLGSLPGSLKNMSGLKELYIGECEIISFHTEASIEALRGLNLHTLLIADIPDFESLPPNLGKLASTLERLGIYRSYDLQDLSGWIEQFSCLKRISFASCPRLKALPASFSQLKNLENMEIWHCTSLSQWCTGDGFKLISFVEVVKIDGVEFKTGKST